MTELAVANRPYRPNLLVIDGGLPQVNAAAAELGELGLGSMYVVGLAKRMEEVWLPGAAYPLVLPRSSEALFLLQRVRDEAHRFAVTLHRDRRSKSMLDSALDAIPGVGPSVLGGSYTPYDGVANPLFTIRALHTALAARGVRYEPGHPVDGISYESGTFTVRAGSEHAVLQGIKHGSTVGGMRAIQILGKIGGAHQKSRKARTASGNGIGRAAALAAATKMNKGLPVPDFQQIQIATMHGQGRGNLGIDQFLHFFFHFIFILYIR